MVLIVEEQVFLVKHYINNASFWECQIAFKSRFGGRTKPSKSVIWKLVKQFRETGCIKVKKHMCQPSIVTPEKAGLLGSPDLASPDLF